MTHVPITLALRFARELEEQEETDGWLAELEDDDDQEDDDDDD